MPRRSAATSTCCSCSITAAPLGVGGAIAWRARSMKPLLDGHGDLQVGRRDRRRVCVLTCVLADEQLRELVLQFLGPAVPICGGEGVHGRPVVLTEGGKQLRRRRRVLEGVGLAGGVDRKSVV